MSTTFVRRPPINYYITRVIISIRREYNTFYEEHSAGILELEPPTIELINRIICLSGYSTSQIMNPLLDTIRSNFIYKKMLIQTSTDDCLRMKVEAITFIRFKS